MPDPIYLIDGHSQIYRAYYAPFRDLTSPTGEPTRATYVFCQMLLKFIADRRPNYLGMAVDGPAEKLRRRQLYPQYKITRKPMPEDLLPQVRRITQIVQALGIPILQSEGYEADDVLATAVERFASSPTPVVIISRDKDLDQLIGPHVVLYDPLKDQTIDAAVLQAEKGYAPDQAVEVQSLSGDSIDNVPGIPGIGPKTAAKLIAQYGSAQAVLEHADELTPKLRQNLLAHAGNIDLARKLVTLDRQTPLPLDLERLRFAGLNGPAVRPLFAELGFNRLLEQLDEMGVGGASRLDVPAVAAASGETSAGNFRYTGIYTEESLEELSKALQGIRRLSVDTETTSTQPMRAQLVGISLSCRPGEACYVPVRAPLGQPALSLESVKRRLGPVLADPHVEKVGQNLKYDLIVLANAGLPLAGKMFDTMIAAYVLDSSRATYKLDALAMDYLRHRSIPIEEVIGRGRNRITMDAAPLDLVTRYSGEDADVALRLSDVLAARLATEGLADLFYRLEMPLMSVLAEMERTGIIVDPQSLKRMETELGKQADILRGRIIAAAAGHFNVDSPRQLADVLFERLHLPILKLTKTGPSTDSDVLEELAAQHELPGLVLDYRKLTKLLTTYVRTLGECIHPGTGRVHTIFHQTGTVTGRLSSSDPNLQNIPIRTEEGRQIRQSFVADEGWRLLTADYSQVELRVLAHLCQDTTLMRAFLDDRDIHRIVAAEVFGVPLEDVTPDQRARAKTVNFGVIYGQTAFGLARTLRISRTAAKEFIDAYHKRFPRIGEFLGQCVRQAKANGYVQTIFGRRRSITEIDSPNPQRRALAERLAINSVVQGSAADLIKQAMVNLAERIRRDRRPSRLLLQIHDELVLEVPADRVEAERTMVVEEMTGAIRLRVPLKVDVGVGINWMEAK